MSSGTAIKLTLRTGTQRANRLFYGGSVLLGAGSPDLDGLAIDLHSLLPEQIKIFHKDGLYFAQNLANDPFVSLNGRPFGRKKLSNGDVLLAGDIEITFELLIGSIPQTAAPISPPTPSLAQALERGIRAKSQPSVIVDSELEALIREVESFEAELKGRTASPEEPAAASKEASVDVPFKASELHSDVARYHAKIGCETIQSTAFQFEDVRLNASLAERHSAKPKRVSLNDDTTQVVRHHFGSHAPPRQIFWRPLLAMLLVVVAIAAALGSGIYFTFSEKNDAEEFVIAEGIADIAMALTYAQLHQLKPPNQNWGDPEFIKECLVKVLPAGYPSLASLDKLGTFTNSSYMFRVYTSNDFSHFLLLAQPEPNLWQWLLSRETILLDSSTMQLHRLTDLRALNRLLANTKPLEGANGLEISHLVSQAPLIRLTTLATETGHREFLPPKGLQKLSPGSDTRTYNAPRYYTFSQQLSSSLGSYLREESTERAAERANELRKQVVDLEKLPQLVIYTIEQEPLLGAIFRQIESWMPDQQVLLAQVVLDSDGQRILTSYIYGHQFFGLGDEDLLGSRKNAIPTVSESDRATIGMDNTPHVMSEVLGRDLTAAVQHRRQALGVPYHALRTLLESFMQAPQENFVTNATQLVQQLENIDLGEQVEIRQAVVDSYRVNVLDNQSLSHSDFVLAAKEAGVAPYIPIEFLRVEQADEGASPVFVQAEPTSGHTLRDFSDVLNRIQQSEDITALGEAVTEANIVLNDLPVEGTDKLRTLRNKYQLVLAHRIEQLVLGPMSPLPVSSINDRGRAQLASLLVSAGIDDEEQKEYYLQEFDRLIERKTPQGSAL